MESNIIGGDRDGRSWRCLPLLNYLIQLLTQVETVGRDTLHPWSSTPLLLGHVKFFL